MALPPTVENLWITVGISLISVGKSWLALNPIEAQGRIFGWEGFYPHKYGGYPPLTHKEFSLYNGVEQDFYFFWGAPPQERSLVTTTTFIYRKSLHTRTFFKSAQVCQTFETFKKNKRR